MRALEIANVEANYGSVRAVQDVSLHVDEGEIVALIGSNGAGKTTLLRTVLGLHPMAAGRIAVFGKDYTRLTAPARVQGGLVLVPEGRGILRTLTVRDNLLMGAYPRRDRREVFRELGPMAERFPILGSRAGQIAGTLSGGEQQILALARALLAKPRILLLDEPSLGLAPLIVDQVFQIIEDLRRKDGLTLLLVEQNARLALEVADRAYVLETGCVTLSGSASELAGNVRVQAIYLGGTLGDAATSS